MTENWDWGTAATTTEVVKKPTSNERKKDSESDLKVEQFSKLNIKDRAFSPRDMRDHMDGRKLVLLSQIEHSQKQLERQDEDSVVIGVVASKSAPRTTSKGSSYCIWTISDLDGNAISLFLFSEAYENHWKEVEGTIVAIINPGVVPANEKGKFSLKAFKEDEVVRLGTSVDFAMCKGTKQSGGRCKFAVNKARVRIQVIIIRIIAT